MSELSVLYDTVMTMENVDCRNELARMICLASTLQAKVEAQGRLISQLEVCLADLCKRTGNPLLAKEVLHGF
jgi:hypothetical protein